MKLTNMFIVLLLIPTIQNASPTPKTIILGGIKKSAIPVPTPRNKLNETNNGPSNLQSNIDDLFKELRAIDKVAPNLLPMTNLDYLPEKKDTPRTVVSMGDQQEIKVDPSNPNRKEIYTCSLSGCIAVGIIEHGDEGSRAILSHYPPISIDQQIMMLKTAINKSKQTAREMVVLVPGEWTKQNDGKWQLSPRKDGLNHLKNLRSAIGIENTTIEPYSTKVSSDDTKRAFNIVLDRDKATWHSFASHYIPHTVEFGPQM